MAGFTLSVEIIMTQIRGSLRRKRRMAQSIGANYNRQIIPAFEDGNIEIITTDELKEGAVAELTPPSGNWIVPPAVQNSEQALQQDELAGDRIESIPDFPPAVAVAEHTFLQEDDELEEIIDDDEPITEIMIKKPAANIRQSADMVSVVPSMPVEPAMAIKPVGIDPVQKEKVLHKVELTLPSANQPFSDMETKLLEIPQELQVAQPASRERVQEFNALPEIPDEAQDFAPVQPEMHIAEISEEVDSGFVFMQRSVLRTPLFFVLGVCIGLAAAQWSFLLKYYVSF
ncbi:MAG: hypothetical protein HRU15_11530 [Planctomycetes bacterium]|nr:hypothetical protein [Planctomycetota bacterium]